MGAPHDRPTSLSTPFLPPNPQQRSKLSSKKRFPATNAQSTSPADGGHAYNSNGTIAIFEPDQRRPLRLHPRNRPLARPPRRVQRRAPCPPRPNWLDNYARDSHVPDPYAQTNRVENVAQNTVVGAFNENVPGGFDTVEANAAAIFHRYATLQTEAEAAAPGNLLRPGGMGTQRLTNRAVVSTQPAISRLPG